MNVSNKRSNDIDDYDDNNWRKNNKFKTLKKIILAITASFVFFFGVMPKQKENKAEAIAISATTALAVGVVATLAVGGYVASLPIAEEIGEAVLDKYQELGGAYEDFKYNTKTKILNFAYSQTMGRAIEYGVTQVINSYSADIEKVEAVNNNYFIDEFGIPTYTITKADTVNYNNLTVRKYLNNMDMLKSDNSNLPLRFPISNYRNYIRNADDVRLRARFNILSNSFSGGSTLKAFLVQKEDNKKMFHLLMDFVDLENGFTGLLNSTTFPDTSLWRMLGFDDLGTASGWLDLRGSYSLNKLSNFSTIALEPVFVSTGQKILDGTASITVGVEYALDIKGNSANTAYENDVSALAVSPDIAAQLGTFPDVEDLEGEIADNLTVGRDYSINTSNKFIDNAADLSAVNMSFASPMNVPEDFEMPEEADGILGVLISIFNFIISIPRLVADAFTGLFEYLASAIQSIDLSTITSTMYTVSGYIQNSIYYVQNAVNSIGSNITSAINSGMTYLLNGMENLWEDAGTVINLGADVATGIGSAVGDVLSGVLDGLVNVGNGIKNLTQDLLDSLINGVGALSGLMSDVLSGLVNGVGAITGVLGDIYTGVTTGVMSGINAATGAITNVWDAIRAGAISITDAIEAGLVTVTDFVTSLIIEKDFDPTPQFTEIKELFMVKINFITAPINALIDIFNSKGSLYDLEIKIFDQTFKPFGTFFSPAVDYVKPFFNGVVVFLTLLNLYRRFSPREAFA